MNYIIKLEKSLENSGVLIDVVTDTVKKKKGGFLGALLASLAASLVEPVIFSVAEGIKV